MGNETAGLFIACAVDLLAAALQGRHRAAIRTTDSLHAAAALVAAARRARSFYRHERYGDPWRAEELDAGELRSLPD